MLKSVKIKVSELEYKRAVRIAKKYQTFDSVEEMDEHVDAFLNEYGIYLSKGEQTILESIQRHSTKAFGVSWRLIDTIVENTGYSVRTIQRTITKLEKWGLFERIPLLKPNGKRWLNLIVIQRQDIWLDAYNDADVDGHFDGVTETSEAKGDNASSDENEKGIFFNHLNLLNKEEEINKQHESEIQNDCLEVVQDKYQVPNEVMKQISPVAKSVDSWTIQDLERAIYKMMNNFQSIGSYSSWFKSTLLNEVAKRKQRQQQEQHQRQEEQRRKASDYIEANEGLNIFASLIESA